MSSEEQKKELRKPCAECPYRRGTEHNGGSPPEVYVGQAMGPFLLSCHLSPGYWKNPRGTEHAQCAGAAIFRANIHRAELMPEFMLKLPQDTEAVFGSYAEMVAHHRQISVEEAQARLLEETPEQLMHKEFCAAGVEVVAAPRKASSDEQPKQVRFKPNTLVAYKGGGYDGCIWEWNYAYIDPQGEFYSFYATGVAGCETLDELNEMYDRLQSQDSRRLTKDVDLYNFDDPLECKRFTALEPIDSILRVAALLQEGGYKVRLPYTCDKCGKEMNLVTSQGTGASLREAGGIQIRNQEIVCEQCVDADAEE